jgi:hypothetical protein|tara:strand:- start:53 stop:793 length:741 start_codon:yes stop_codon:yes gene_type:complete
MTSQSQVGFDDWLEQVTDLSPKTIRNYFSAIKGSLSARCLEYGIVKKNLLLVSDAELFDDVRQCLEGDERYIALNKKGNDMYKRAMDYYSKYLGSSVSVPTQEEDEETHPLLTTDTISVIKARRGQGVFRRNLEEYWGNKCSVTQAPDSSCGTILIASHIKPWVMSNNREKLDVNNGFLLLPNLDKTFDKGYISFADNGTILVSSKLSCSAELGIVEGMSINQEKLNDSHRQYLDFHRGNIFIGDG